LELDAPEQSALDPRSIVVAFDDEPMVTMPPQVRPEPTIVWQGAIGGDGTGPQSTYCVRLYADGTAHCQCPDFDFRSTLRRDASYACKHVKRALSAIPQP
jgi:SWIM zinc finger